jgi:hypothetical protein
MRALSRSPSAARNNVADEAGACPPDGHISVLQALSRPLSRTSKFSSGLEHLPVTTFGKADRKMTLAPLRLNSNNETDDAILSDRSRRSVSPGARRSRPVSCSPWAAPATHVASTGNCAADEYLAARPWAATPTPDLVDYKLLILGEDTKTSAKPRKDEAAQSEAPTSVISRPSDSCSSQSLRGMYHRQPAAWQVEAQAREQRALSRKAAVVYRARDHWQWNGPQCRDATGRPVSTFGAGRPDIKHDTLAGPGAYRINVHDIGDVPHLQASTLKSADRGAVMITRSGLVGNLRDLKAAPKVGEAHHRETPSICRGSGTKNAALLQAEQHRRQLILRV